MWNNIRKSDASFVFYQNYLIFLKDYIFGWIMKFIFSASWPFVTEM